MIKLKIITSEVKNRNSFLLKQIPSFLLCLLFFVISSCTRDDICPETTETTPRLIVTFNDIANPTQRKAVEGLQVRTVDENETLIPAISSDSIVLPLRTGADFTRYSFIRDAETMDELTDVLLFAYDREDIYINRACSFKTIYQNLAATEEEDPTQDWIQNIIINTTTVEDETAAHITILH